MAINLLLGVSVQSLELVQEVLARRLIIVLRSVVIGEPVIRNRALGELLLEQIHLIQEEDQR